METSSDLSAVGAKAIEEHAAWQARNTARRAFRQFMKWWRDETGEGYFDREEMVRVGEMEDVEKFDALKAVIKEAQRVLTAKRAATRRAAASINKAAR